MAKAKASAKKEDHKSKKPIRPGINSGRVLQQRLQLKSSVGMTARSCDSTFKEIAQLASKNKVEITFERFPLLNDKPIPFNEKTREIDSQDLSVLKSLEKHLITHSKFLSTELAKFTKPKPKKFDKSAPKKADNKSQPKGKPVVKKPVDMASKVAEFKAKLTPEIRFGRKPTIEVK